MPKLLAVVSTTHYCQGVICRALDDAQAANGLTGDASAATTVTLLYGMEDGRLDEGLTPARESDWLGNEPHDDLVRAVYEVRDRLAATRIDLARHLAGERHVALEVRETAAPYVEAANELLDGEHFDAIYLTRANRTCFSRLLFGSEVDAVVRHVQDGAAPARVIVV